MVESIELEPSGAPPVWERLEMYMKTIARASHSIDSSYSHMRALADIHGADNNSPVRSTRRGRDSSRLRDSCRSHSPSSPKRPSGLNRGARKHDLSRSRSPIHVRHVGRDMVKIPHRDSERLPVRRSEGRRGLGSPTYPCGLKSGARRTKLRSPKRPRGLDCGAGYLTVPCHPVNDCSSSTSTHVLPGRHSLRRHSSEASSGSEYAPPPRLASKVVPMEGYRNTHAKGSSSQSSRSNPLKGKGLARRSSFPYECQSVDHDSEVGSSYCYSVDGRDDALDSSLNSEQTNKSPFVIIGGSSEPTWSPSPDALSWFMNVCDLEVKHTALPDLLERFVPPETLAKHFTPPRLPSALWGATKSSNYSKMEQKSVFRAQEFIYAALMPLLSVLDYVSDKDPDARNDLTSAIQFLCTSNLQLNRFRRALAAPKLSVM